MRSIWALTPTDEGERMMPNYEVNTMFVIVARSPREARVYAEEGAIDEPDGLWLSPLTSRLSKIGVCTNTRVRSGVIAAENNAS